MESKIQVGEYIRTNDGYIRKVKFADDTSIISLDKDILEKVEGYDEYIIIDLIEITDIKNHSFNIIDLIEEGDILKVREGNIIFWLGIEKGDTQFNHRELMYSIKNKEVELLSIVTKEQFKSVEYDV